MKRRRKAEELPVRLLQSRERLAAWRGSHRKGSRLPESLWTDAVLLAREYGHNRTARALGLDYYSLKKRVAAASVSGAGVGEAGPSFVEVIPAAPRQSIIEVERLDGSKLRVTLTGASSSEVSQLSRELWAGAS